MKLLTLLVSSLGTHGEQVHTCERFYSQICHRIYVESFINENIMFEALGKRRHNTLNKLFYSANKYHVCNIYGYELTCAKLFIWRGDEKKKKTI